MIIRMIGANIQLFFYIRKEQSKKGIKKGQPLMRKLHLFQQTIESLFIPPNARIETVATSHTAHSLFIVGGVNLIF